MLDASVCEIAPAKINLHLRVGCKRTDGFHEIESIFQAISLFDCVSVRVSEVFSLRCVNFDLPTENSLTKAYNVFCAMTGFQKPVEIAALKRIPTCAGLGGASTDAVALLKALNRLSGAGLSERELSSLALEVGSDCPFFVKAGAAFVAGRGEIVEPIKSASGCGLLLVPHAKSRTEQAYALLDKTRTSGSVELTRERKSRLIAMYATGEFSTWRGSSELFVNDFEKVIFENRREVAEAKDALLKAGADFALMTGSGSVVFGLFQSSERLRSAEINLKKRFRFCEPFVFI